MSDVTIRKGQNADGTVRVRHEAETGNLDYYSAYGTTSNWGTVSFGFESQHMMLIVTSGDIGIASWSYGNGTVFGTVAPGEYLTFDGLSRSEVDFKCASNADTVVRVKAWA